MRIPLLFITCVVAPSILSPANPDAQAKNQFSVTLRTPNEPTKSGTELRLRVTITNVSNHDVVFERTPGAIPDETLTYHVEIRDEHGQAPEKTAFFHDRNENEGAFGSYTRYVLKPGESFDDAIVVTRLYTLAKPGKYRISVARGQRALGGPPKDAVRSNEITAVVVP